MTARARRSRGAARGVLNGPTNPGPRRGRPLSSASASAAIADITIEPSPGPAPEAVFDRVTGPYGGRRAGHDAPGFGAHDGET